MFTETPVPVEEDTTTPQEHLSAAILIKVYPNGQWTLTNHLDDSPLASSGVYDLLSTIVEEFAAEIQAEKVLAKIRQKLGGSF
jgi:hypothetical protein